MKNFEITKQLKDRGIENKLLLQIFLEVTNEFSAFIEKETFSPEKSVSTEPGLMEIASILGQINIERGKKFLAIGIDSLYIILVLSKIYEQVFVVVSKKEKAKSILNELNKLQIKTVFLIADIWKTDWLETHLFDAILITTEVNEVPDKLKKHLNTGGKLLRAIGKDWKPIIFEIAEKISQTEFKEELIRGEYFIPKPKFLPEVLSNGHPDQEIVDEIKVRAISFDATSNFPVDQLLKRIGNAQLVLLGEASHGTSEFYNTRQEITKALIEQKGFDFVCAEADWSDAEQINNYVRKKNHRSNWMPFARFPKWMWRNTEVLHFVEWMKKYNAKHQNKHGFYGLDLYGLENSIDLVIKYLEQEDIELANMAKSRYACITPYMSDPAVYGKLLHSKQLKSCEKHVLKMLADLLKNKLRLNHSPEYFYACQNAAVVVDAERYYKSMFYGNEESWNLRDFHMFYTILSLLSYFGSNKKIVVWAHNSHIGNAVATEMYSHGEINIGHLCKEYFGNSSYHIGFGTHTGTVAAAHNWGDEMQVMPVNDSRYDSYENLCYQSNIPAFTLPLSTKDSGKKLKELLSTPKLERAIGVIYRPKTELSSHYFHAVLSAQFDEYIFFKNSKAVTPISVASVPEKLLPNHPFGFIDT